MVFFDPVIRLASISPMLKRLAAGFAMISSTVIFSSCGVGGARPVEAPPEPILYGWHDDGGPGKVTVRISLPDQIAEYHRGDRLIGWSYVATGKEGHGTRAGTYRIMEKIEDKYSNKYGWIEDELGNVVDGDAKVGDRVPKGMKYVPAPMPFWMRLTSYGIGMHGGLIPEPGKPASHGCIRLPKDFVPLVYDVVQVGTPVTITQEPSRHGPISPPVDAQLATNNGAAPLSAPAPTTPTSAPMP